MNNPAKNLAFVPCQVGDETYGISASAVISIDRADRLQSPSSNTPPTDQPVAGWLPVSNGTAPIYSLSERLQRTSDVDPQMQRIIVLKIADATWGFLVDAIAPVVQVPPDHYVSMPKIAVNPSANYFDGIIRQEDATLILNLALERLYPEFSVNGTTHPQVDAMPVAVKSNGIARPNPKQGSNSTLLFFSSLSSSDNKRLAYGLSMTQVLQVVDMPPTISVPMAPKQVIGLAAWKEDVVPVLDLDFSVGLSASAQPHVNMENQLAVVRVPYTDTLASFPISRGIRSVELPISHELYPHKSAFNDGMVKGAYIVGQETLIIPDLATIAS